MFKILIGIQIILVVIIVVLLILINYLRSEIQKDLKSKYSIKVNIAGRFYGNTFYSKPMFSLEIKTKDKEIQAAIKSHNKFINYY